MRLWQGYWRGVAMHEFKYAIIVLDNRTTTRVELFDRDLAKPYIDPVRPLVLSCVGAATKTLVAAMRPQIIYRATYLVDPPIPTLAKHQIVTDILLEEGYEVLDAGADRHGRRFWLMVKIEDER